jgi:hypothetical protein
MEYSLVERHINAQTPSATWALGIGGRRRNYIIPATLGWLDDLETIKGGTRVSNTRDNKRIGQVWCEKRDRDRRGAVIWRDMVLHHVTWYDIMWHGMTSCDIVLHHVTWYDIMWHGMTSCDMVWHHVTWFYIMWHDMTSCDMVLHHVTWYDIMWHGFTSCDMVWHHVTWFYIMWHGITSCDMHHARIWWLVTPKMSESGQYMIAKHPFTRHRTFGN